MVEIKSEAGELPAEIVYSGSRLPSHKELARMSATPGPVFLLDENGVEFSLVDGKLIELPERYEDRYPEMSLGPKMQREFADARRRVLARSTLPSYDESKAVAARREVPKLRFVNIGRLTIEDLPLLFSGDQVFVRREIAGPIKEWFVALLIRVVTFTRRDKRPTIVNHVANIVRAIREVDREILVRIGTEPEAPVRAREMQILDELDTYYRYRNGGDSDVRFAIKGRRVELPASRGPIVDWVIAEALGKGGFQDRRLLEVYGDPRLYSIAVARHKLATPAHRDKMLAACESLIGRKYGYLKLGAHVLDYGLTSFWNLAGGRGDVLAFRWLCRSERYPICSWASLYIYRKAGLPFSTPLETGSPDDLWDECRRKAIEIWVWPFFSPKLRSELLGPGFGGTREGRMQ